MTRKKDTEERSVKSAASSRNFLTKGKTSKNKIIDAYVEAGDPFWLDFEKNMVEWKDNPDYKKKKICK